MALSIAPTLAATMDSGLCNRLGHLAVCKGVDARRAVVAALAVAVLAGCGLHAGGVPGGRARPSPTVPGKHLAPAAPLTGPLVIDLTWISARQGWALEAAPCARGLCPLLAATTDGGRTWRKLASPPGVIQYQDGAPGLSQIRFATARIGYLYGPALYQTTDGGRTWHRVPGPPVEALQPAAGTVVRVAYHGTGCPGPCTRLMQEATAGTARWRTLLRITPPPAESQAVASQVIRQGKSVIYVPVYGNLAAGIGSQHTVIFRTTDGGATWARLPDPCPGTGTATHDTIGLAAAPGGFLAALCAPRDQIGSTFVLTSADHGSAWGAPRPVPASGAGYLIAAASPARLAVATGGASGSGPYRYRLLVSADGGRYWTTAVTGVTQLNPQAPAVYGIGFTRAAGWWISDPRTFWLTDDKGLTWRRHAVG